MYRKDNPKSGQNTRVAAEDVPQEEPEERKEHQTPSEKGFASRSQRIEGWNGDPARLKKSSCEINHQNKSVQCAGGVATGFPL
ncbi:hypothetical protein V5799_024185 [Amblyomma americanum]|uniref:Uncharacterized protein n=1 Tax=Amblyomma americanum TaxID=6943 RepID=A0AAQ4ED52_AMBAM